MAQPQGGPRLVLGALVIALVAAGAYILHLQSRVAALEGRLANSGIPAAAAPAATVAPAPAAEPAPTIVAANLFTAEQEAAVLQPLAAQTDPGRKAWIVFHQANPQSAGIALALQQTFEKAGWPTQMDRYPHPLKSGVFLLAGDEVPPPFVDTVNEALTAGGLELQYLTGYRAFVAERKSANPKWVGPELTADQAFSIVVGARE